MSTFVIILISLIPIVVALIASLVFIILKKSKSDKRMGVMDEYKNIFSFEKITKTKVVIDRVSNIVNKNNEFANKFDELEGIYEEMNEKFRSAKSLYEELLKDVKKLSKSEFNEKRTVIDDLVVNLRKLERDFDRVTGHITQQEEFLHSEHVYYTKYLREAIEVYRFKRLTLERISDKIDELNEEIKEKSNEFNKFVKEAKNKDASASLAEYSKLVVKYIKVISEAPQIESYIYHTIPKIVSNMNEMYKQKKNELSAPLQHINFKESLINIASLFNKAKINYNALNMDNAKEYIIKILKSVEVLKRLINFEISSRNFFVANYEDSIIQTKQALQWYVHIKKQIKNIIGNGHSISPDVNSLLSEIQVLSKEIDNSALSFRESMKSKTIPYSSKVSKMKMLLQRVQIFIEKLNEVLQHLWSVNIESSIIKNKFRKSEAAINEILANLKKQNVKLSSTEKIQYDSISGSLNNISKNIESGKISKELKDQVDQLMANTTSFYKVVGGNIQIAEIVENLIKELSPKRATDTKLNVSLNSAEKAYLEGKYAHALNTIITELEQGGK